MHSKKQLCYNYKEQWETSHRCKGSGKLHDIEVLPYHEEKTLSIQEGEPYKGEPQNLKTTKEICDELPFENNFISQEEDNEKAEVIDESLCAPHE